MRKNYHFVVSFPFVRSPSPVALPLVGLLSLRSMASRLPIIKNSSKPIAELPFDHGINLRTLLPDESEIINLIELPERQGYMTVTYEEFVDLVPTKPFLENLLNSIKNLTEFRLEFYKDVIKRQTELVKNTKAMVEDLKTSGISEDEIERQCPGYSTSSSIVALARTIQHDLITRLKTLTLRTLSDSVTKAFTDPKDGLASLRGQFEVKEFLAKTLFAFSKNWKILGNPFKNIALYGPPGSGKGKIARVIGHCLYHFFIVENRAPKIVTSTDLIGSHVGKTAPRVRGNFFEGLGRVLFLDEAYQMGQSDYGTEGLTELVSLLDLYAPVSVVIVAGYRNEMLKNFMPKNKGLHRRFPFQFSLEKYDALELSQLLKEEMIELLPEGSTFSAEDSSLIFSLLNRILIEDPDVFEYQASDIKEIAREATMNIGSDWSNLDTGQKLAIFEDSIQGIINKKEMRNEV